MKVKAVKFVKVVSCVCSHALEHAHNRRHFAWQGARWGVRISPWGGAKGGDCKTPARSCLHWSTSLSVEQRWMEIRVCLNSTVTGAAGRLAVNVSIQRLKVPRVAKSLLVSSSRFHWWSEEAGWLRNRCLQLLRQNKLYVLRCKATVCYCCNLRLISHFLFFYSLVCKRPFKIPIAQGDIYILNLYQYKTEKKSKSSHLRNWILQNFWGVSWEITLI